MSNQNPLLHKKGDLIIFTSGEYSDYGICQLCRALKDFDEEKVYEDFIAKENSKPRWKRKKSEYDYLSFYRSEGLIEDVARSEINLGSYGKAQLWHSPTTR